MLPLDNKSITKLQKLYREKELKKSAIKLKDTFNDLYYGIVDNYDKYLEINNISMLENDFDVFTKILVDKNTINKFDNFIKKYYLLVKFDVNISKKITSRKLLSSFMIYGFPEVIMEKSRKNLNNLDADLTYYSKKIMDIMHNYINNKTDKEDLRKLIKTMNMYSNSFDLFLQKDKIKLINKTTMEWYQISKTIDEIKTSEKYNNLDEESSKEKILKNLKQTLLNLEEMISMINPKFKKDNLTIYKKVTDNFDKTLKKAYWDLLKLDLITENNDHRENILKNQIINILQDLKGLCIATKYKNLEENIITHLDNSFLKELCKPENNTENYHLWIEFGEFITDTFLSIHSMDRDTDTILKWNKIKTGNYENINEIIFEIIKYSNEELNNIFSDIYNLALMTSLNIGPLLKK